MMLRSVYVRILNLHPAVFRERFGDEMLDIFDQRAGMRTSLLLLGDILMSLFRQWAMRSDFHPGPTAASPGACSDITIFQPIAGYRPRSSALLQGGVIAVVALGTVVWAAGKGGRLSNILIGVHHPSPHLIGVDRASVAGSELTTTIKFGRAPEDPWRPAAAVYFKIVRVLDTLDADKDLIISPWEMFTAPAALRKLDTDHDGQLSPEECGFFVGAHRSLPLSEIARLRRGFMLGNPVLATLDENHDGLISATEIEHSPSRLKDLDRNGDGSLTPGELMPDEETVELATIMMGLDTNGDGRVSRTERQSAGGQYAQELLDAADANHDGMVTRAELAAELRLRAERKRELEGARRAAGLR